MQVIPFDSAARRRAGTRNSSAALVLAATLAAGTAIGAEQVERADPVPAAPAVPAASASPDIGAESAREQKLEDAKRRLEKAAAEVAALSSEIASQAMQNVVVGPRRSIIGVQIESVESSPGARVREVSPGGAAEAAGVKVGDIITAVDGVVIKEGAREVVRMLRKVEPEKTVKLRVMREGSGGAKVTKDLTVTARPFDAKAFAFLPKDFNYDFDFDFDPEMFQFGPFGERAVSGGLGGMQLTALTPQLARYFGADKGLLVLRAPKNEVYKLQDGDVILSIDGRVPTSGSHVTRILRSYQPGETLTMRIMRDRKPQELQITLPQREQRQRTRSAWSDRDSTTL